VSATADAEDAVSAWRRNRDAALCDVLEPWDHGVIARASRYPRVHVLNLMRVEEDPGLDAEALARAADAGLAGLSHRRLEFDRASWGEPLREGFHRLGWETERDVWLRYGGEIPPMPAGVEEVPWAVANGLREQWHHEDRPDDHDMRYLKEWEEINSVLDVRVWVVREAGEPVAFAAAERAGGSAEVGPVYVRADRRGNGLGATVIRAALAATGRVPGTIWIAADDEGRPRRLYERLGFEPVCTTLDATWWPAS
jgi:GNAT superfamily N-acetyltransferase